MRDHHLQAANTYFPVGATYFGPFSNTQIDFTCLPSTVRVHRCCALHHDGDRLQLAAAPGRRDHSSHPVCFSTPAHVWNAREQARTSMGQDQAYAGCSFRAGPDRFFCHELRKHAGMMKSGTIWQSPIFGQDSIRCL